MAQITIGSTRTAVVSALGIPVKESTESGLAVLWYTSKSPMLADFYMFSGDLLVFKSTSLYRQPAVLSDLLTAYGRPDYSIPRYDDTAQDSLRQTVHVWAARGKAVTTSGSETASPVIREDEFAATTAAGYAATWGSGYLTHTKTTITDPATPLPSHSAISLPLMAVAVCAVIALIIAWRLYARRRHHLPATR